MPVLSRPHAIVLLLALGNPGPGESQVPACASDAHRAFDFWIGSWEVRRPDGSVAGHNTIRRLMGGCVLHERYTTPTGYEGESLNIYDASRGVWHQTWVDSGGLLLRLEGGLSDGRMVLEGETRDSLGNATLNRITWSPLESDPDRVRQHWEVTRDGGLNWTTAFDGLYVPTSGGGESNGTVPAGTDGREAPDETTDTPILGGESRSSGGLKR
jgi:hypothetical protein